MRIKNKYLRNRAICAKQWNCIRRKSHPFETMCSNPEYHHIYSYEEQVKNHFEWIAEQARALDKGSHRQPFYTAPKWFRKQIKRNRKSHERVIMAKIRQGDYDAEMPKWKNDAAWLYW